MSQASTQWASLSNASFVIAVATYLIAVAVHFAAVAWASRRLDAAAVVVTAVGAVAHLAAVAFRALAAGRAPWGNMYEFSMSGSLVAVIAYLVARARMTVSSVGGFVLGGVAIWMGVGWVLYAEPGPLQPALRSNWLVFHVFLVMSGAALLLLSSVISGLYLWRAAWESRAGIADRDATSEDFAVPDRVLEVGSEAAGVSEGPGAEVARSAAGRSGLARTFPPSGSLDRLAYRLVIVAFPIWTLGVIFGAVWGEQAWGRYWGWDPKETWSFIVWMIFATYLHARATRGWKGKPAALLSLVGGAAILFNTFAVNLWIAGLHSYAGV